MRGRLRAVLAVWAGWTALALFLSISTALTYASTGRPASWTTTIVRALAEWWVWALLTPLVAWLARIAPIERPHAARNTLVHVAIGSVTAFVKMAADRAIFAWWTGFWTYWLASNFALQFSVYLLLVAAAHGLRYRARSREREQLEARLTETRLQLLNMQLQPHFLFNTLNTIAELVHTDPDTADRMIAGLSELLRRALDMGAAQDIPLSKELELLDLYLAIQKARFGDRLQVRIDVADDVAGTRVPVLLLQPLVENAITHGLAARLAAGSIDIIARGSTDAVRIRVQDDGGATDAPGRERVGLGNTRERLVALYGPLATLELTIDPGRGTCVTLQLPRKPTAMPA